MTKDVRQTSIQITKATDKQVEHLKALGYGAFTDIVRLAIDRMFNLERDKKNDKKTES